MSLPVLLVSLAVGLSLAMMLAWWVAQRTGNAGWIDTTWSLAVGVAGVTAALVPLAAGGPSLRQLLVAGLAGLWSLRLGLHIAARTLRGKDDPRYARLREEWGDDADRRLFWFLQIQAAAGFLLAVSILLAARNPLAELRGLDLLGVLVLAVAIAGESLADRQLAVFRADPGQRGRVCDIGLWGWSRHPNYFFEWLGWAGYALVALDVSGAYPWGWLALGGPAFMYWLLVHVSGVPLLEQHMLRSRGDAFRDYQRRVNAFWPGPPAGPAER